MLISMCSKLHASPFSPRTQTKEASVIGKFRAASVIILGKANMSQWGNSRSSPSTSSNGWSAVDGQTYGVYVHHQDPCGSSSGSTTAMALELAAVTIGVETLIERTVGSITCLAMRSNLRGSVGPITRTVKDAAMLLTVTAGHGSDNPATSNIPYDADKIPNYASSCKHDRLRGKRLGVPRNSLENPFAADMNVTSMMKAFDNALEVMINAGATIIDNDAPQKIFGPTEYKFDMESYFRKLARKADDFFSPRVVAAKERMLYLGGPGGIDGPLDAARADALVLPSVCSSDAPGLVGCPVICVPLGFMTDDTRQFGAGGAGYSCDRFGISFIGRAFSDQGLIELAFAFEQLMSHSGAQRKPIVLPTIDLPILAGRHKWSAVWQGLMASVAW
ncbi:amidase signature domain-containing protein [Podospora didyma]|uniref:Amidase signature domain-containing protein n=1 Tax=Podospora didyma TaxID=330526 RepID=A0AAE0NHW2_9PEZI|nr:amidase signature domain-containing protein [Podospora didyma]